MEAAKGGAAMGRGSHGEGHSHGEGQPWGGAQEGGRGGGHKGEVSVWDGALRCTAGGVGLGEACSEWESNMLRAWMKLEWRRPVSTIVRIRCMNRIETWV